VSGNVFQYPARLQRVVDGDTVYAELDLGFHMRAVQSIRLADINAPELFRGDVGERKQGELARQFLSSLISAAEKTHADQEWPFIVETGKDQSFGRWVGTIWPVGRLDYSLNAEMVDGGHAVWSKR